jgi:hypothetical protein
MATWTVARRAFAGALGLEPSQAREFEEGFERRTDAMIDAFLRSAERRGR